MENKQTYNNILITLVLVISLKTQGKVPKYRNRIIEGSYCKPSNNLLKGRDTEGADVEHSWQNLYQLHSMLRLWKSKYINMPNYIGKVNTQKTKQNLNSKESTSPNRAFNFKDTKSSARVVPIFTIAVLAPASWAALRNPKAISCRSNLLKKNYSLCLELEIHIQNWGKFPQK